MSAYAVSDVHGCYDELQTALGLAEFSQGDHLFVLGDLIDRGPKIGACIEWLVNAGANEEGSHVHFLMGNHEELALWAFAGRWSDFEFDEIMLNPWLRNGGGETIAQMRELGAGTIDAFERMVRRAEKAKAIRVNGEIILMCHAGIRPAEPESEEAEWLIQSADDLLWIGSEWYCATDQPPFHVVSGHVPVYALATNTTIPGCTQEVIDEGSAWYMMHWGRKHDIDCGCVYGGRLGVLRLQDWEEFYAKSHSVR